MPQPWSRASTPVDEPAAGMSLWARPAPPAQERVTARARKMVENLPAWEPLPPGEILVRRRASA